MCRGVAKDVFIASKALLADCFQSVQRGGDRALVVVCGGHAVMYHVNLALTMNKTQRKVQRQRRLCRGIAKGVFIASKALLAVCFQSVQCVGGRMWRSCGGVLRKSLALTMNKAKISFVNIPIRQQMYRQKT